MDRAFQHKFVMCECVLNIGKGITVEETLLNHVS